MSEETNKSKQESNQNDSPKPRPNQDNNSKQEWISEQRSYSERIGDQINKGEATSEGHYAKPFVNQIIQSTPLPGATTPASGDAGSNGSGSDN